MALLPSCTITASLEPAFLTASPLSTDYEKHLFELLRQAYVDSRYDPIYTITKEELEWFAEPRLKNLGLSL